MTLNDKQIKSYLSALQQELLTSSNFKAITLRGPGPRKLLMTPAFTCLKKATKILYVGETGNLRERMTDLIYTRKHAFRRTIGATLFSDHAEFKKATLRKTFPDVIESLVEGYIRGRLQVFYKKVNLGRKELEELIQSNYSKSNSIKQNR